MAYRKGREECLYINAYHNTDSPVHWLRMAGHENMANCKIRRMPSSQGGGLGVYAMKDIEYAQALLIVNREYPTGMEEEPQVAAPYQVLMHRIRPVQMQAQ